MDFSAWNLLGSSKAQASIPEQKRGEVPFLLQRPQTPIQVVESDTKPGEGYVEVGKSPMRKPAAVSQPPAPMTQQQIPQNIDPEAQYVELYQQSLRDRQSDTDKLQDQLGGLKAPSQFQSADLSGLMSFADQVSGSNLAQNYRAPSAKKDFEAQRALLQNAVAANKSKITDDQLGYLKMKADAKKNEEANRLREFIASQRMARGQDGDASKTEDRMYNQFVSHPAYKNMASISDAYGKISANPAKGGPAQQALVFAYSKILDPNSVVRESEYAQSAANAGRINQAKMLLDKWSSGESLSDQQVAEMKEVSRLLVESARQPLSQLESQFRGKAQRRGLDPENIILNPFDGVGVKPTQPQSSVDPIEAKKQRMAALLAKQNATVK